MAFALSKLGLRNFAGPFDWIRSQNFDSVIKLIDNEFKDFMKKANLEVNDADPTVFSDKKYNFICPHDIKENFETEYSDIYDKYTKRARRFVEKIKKPTCFFRAVRSEEEIDYIIRNADYIDNVLKQYNPRNSIVYAVKNDMSSLPNNLKWFRLPLNKYIGRMYEMRTLFDKPEELFELCATLLRTEQINLNKEYDIQKYGQVAAAAEVAHYVNNNIDGIDAKILDMFKLKDNEVFYIWGAGNYGISLYHYLVNRGVEVKAIIDNKDRNELPDGILIISPNDIENHSKVFIAVANEESNFEIIEQIKEKECSILTYKELIYSDSK